MRIKVLSGGRKSIELPLSDAELNFQMKRIGIEETVPVCRLVEASEKVDSVFYNFQKGSFSAICLLKDGGLTTFFGNYSLKGAEISIILLPESVNDKNYDTYFGWPEGKCTFKVEDLSYSSLRLEYEGTKSIFRKF